MSTVTATLTATSSPLASFVGKPVPFAGSTQYWLTILLLSACIFALVFLMVWRDRHTLLNFRTEFPKWYNEVRGLNPASTTAEMQPMNSNSNDQLDGESEDREEEDDGGEYRISLDLQHDPQTPSKADGSPQKALDPNVQHYVIQDDQEEQDEKQD